MKFEIVKDTNGLNEVTYRSYVVNDQGERTGTVGLAFTYEAVVSQTERYVSKCKVQTEVIETLEF